MYYKQNLLNILQEIVTIINKKGDGRARDEIQKLKRFFEDLSFFTNLKKEGEADDETIY